MTVCELLSDESRWTRGWFAKDGDGDNCGSLSPNAVCWCIDGAIFKCYPVHEDRCRAIVKIQVVIGEQFVEWNDDPTTTFADIRRVIERAGI